MKKTFREAIKATNSGKEFPVMDLVRQGPEIAAMISKLVKAPVQPTYDKDGERTLNVPIHNNFLQTSNEISEKSNDAENIFQLFPDMELSAQILISSIISPKDLGGGEISYSVPDSMASNETTAQMVSAIKDYFEKVYKISPILPKMLRDVLFEKGSYPMLVIPESSLDEVINGSTRLSMEALSEVVTSKGDAKALGILGDPAKSNNATSLSMESFSFAPKKEVDSRMTFRKDQSAAFERLSDIHVFDNPFIFKIPRIAERQRLEAASSIVQSVSRSGLASEKLKLRKTAYGAEGYDQHRMTDSEMTSLVYKNRQNQQTTFLRLKGQDQIARNTVGAPLVMKLPPESVIPVYTPGHPEKHVGYFVLIDIEGNPLSKDSITDHFGDLQTRIQGVSRNMSSFMDERVKQAFNPTTGVPESVMAAKIFADVVEADLLARLRNGVVGTNVAIAKNDEVFRIMFARVLAKQRTNLVYVPADMITYFAYKYDKKGIGKSLMDDMRILNSLRAMNLFARVMASIKNSIGRTAIALKLDEQDPNPQKTIEIAMHEIARTRQQLFPVGMNNPSDMADWISKAGYEYTFSGHPGIPDVTIDFSEKSSNYVKPDTELEEELKKRAIMTLGLSPETVDNGFNAEFATSVVANNILLTKRVMQMHDVFVPLLTDHARKVAFNDGNLVAKLKKIVIDNKDKVVEAYKDIIPKEYLGDIERCAILIVSEFISNFELSLPQPDSVTLENQTTAFESFEKAVEAAIKYYVSEETMPEGMMGKAGAQATTIQNLIKAYVMRDWMARNGYVDELREFMTDFNEGDLNSETQKYIAEHAQNVIKMVVGITNQIYPVKKGADADLDKITDGEDLGSGGSAFSSSGGGGGFGSDSGGGGGGFDFGGGDMTGTGGDSDTGGLGGTDTPEDGNDTGNGSGEPEGGGESIQQGGGEDNLPDLGGLPG
jgi:uncharacterized membrane protein YgcG